MNAYIACFLMIVAVRGAPGIFKGGFNFGGSVGTKVTAGGNIEGRLTDPLLLNVDGSSQLGAAAEGALHGGGFAGYNDNFIGTNGDIHGSVGGQVSDSYQGILGVDKEGYGHLGLTDSILSSGHFNGGGSGYLATDREAQDYVRLYGASCNMQKMLNNMY